MGIFQPKDASAFSAPPEVYNWRVYALALSASMASAMFGYDSAFIGGSLSLKSFDQEFGLDSAQGKALSALKANIVSTFQAGCFFGAIGVYFVTERFGRRLTLMLCGLLFGIGAIVQLVSSGHVGAIYGGRVLCGLAVGSSSLVVPVYIAETSPPAIRGRLVGMFECMLQIFLVIGFWVNYGVDINVSDTSSAQWQIPFGLQLVPAALLIILMFFQPESPRWLIKRGRTEKAIANMTQLRQLPSDHEYIVWEFNCIQRQIEQEQATSEDNTFTAKAKEIFSVSNRPRLALGISLMFLQNLSGINALNYYSPIIFKSIGFTGSSVGLLATGIFGIVKASATIIFMFFGIDRLGRRTSMLIGSFGAMVALYYLGGYSAQSHSFSGKVHPPKDAGAYIAILMVYVFAVFYAISWNGIPWIFCAEVFPLGIRSVCLVFTTCAQWLAQFIIVYSTPYMITGITYGTFLFFASSVVVGIVVIYFFLPETKGLSMEEMDILFTRTGTAKQKRRQADEVIAERTAALLLGRAGKQSIVHIEEV